MSFKEKGLVTLKTVDGKLHEQVESETIITLTNKVTGQEYESDAHGDADVDDPNTTTQKEHLKRSMVNFRKKWKAKRLLQLPTR